MHPQYVGVEINRSLQVADPQHGMEYPHMRPSRWLDFD
jgi:hypothetical protein